LSIGIGFIVSAHAEPISCLRKVKVVALEDNKVVPAYTKVEYKNGYKIWAVPKGFE
jgi:hypothetical protein